MKKEPSMSEFLPVFDDILGVKTLPTFGQIFGRLAIFSGQIGKNGRAKSGKMQKNCKIGQKKWAIGHFFRQKWPQLFFSRMTQIRALRGVSCNKNAYFAHFPTFFLY